MTAHELKAYLTEKVPYRAQRMHSRNQTPQVVGQNRTVSVTLTSAQ